MNELLTHYPEEINKILGKYPADRRRAAIMPLLHLAQRKNTRLSRCDIADVAEICAVSETDVTSIAGFYTLFHEENASDGSAQPSRYRIQVCTDLPCALRGAKEFYKNLCQALDLGNGTNTTPDGLITVEEVTCLAACHRAPMFQLQGDGHLDYYENQTLENVLRLVEDLRMRTGSEETA